MLTLLFCCLMSFCFGFVMGQIIVPLFGPVGYY